MSWKTVCNVVDFSACLSSTDAVMFHHFPFTFMSPTNFFIYVSSSIFPLHSPHLTYLNLSAVFLIHTFSSMIGMLNSPPVAGGFINVSQATWILLTGSSTVEKFQSYRLENVADILQCPLALLVLAYFHSGSHTVVYGQIWPSASIDLNSSRSFKNNALFCSFLFKTAPSLGRPAEFDRHSTPANTGKSPSGTWILIWLWQVCGL